MQGDIRTPEERARDVNRMPAEILEFFRMREDMRVIEILPAGGWYTKILGPVLKERGKLYVTHPPGFYADMFGRVADLPEHGVRGVLQGHLQDADAVAGFQVLQAKLDGVRAHQVGALGDVGGNRAVFDRAQGFDDFLLVVGHDARFARWAVGNRQ